MTKGRPGGTHLKEISGMAEGHAVRLPLKVYLQLRATKFRRLFPGTSPSRLPPPRACPRLFHRLVDLSRQAPALRSGTDE